MSELHVMNHKQATASADAAEWQVEVDKEQDRMVKNNVWEIVPKANMPPKTKILKSMCIMKPKADGSKHTCLNTKGCSQIAGQHYDADNILSPVMKSFSICIALMIMLLCVFFGFGS